jgi:hypothetical protein
MAMMYAGLEMALNWSQCYYLLNALAKRVGHFDTKHAPFHMYVLEKIITLRLSTFTKTRVKTPGGWRS